MNRMVTLLIVFLLGFAGRAWSQGQKPEIVLQTGHSQPINELAFSPNGRWLASASDGLKLWELATGRVWQTRGGHAGEVTGAAFSRDSQLVASCGADETIRIWEVEGRREVQTLDGHSDPVNAVAFSPDGRTLASAAGEAFGGRGDNTVRLWNVTTGQELLTLRGHESQVSSVAFSPNGRLLASSSYDKTARIWDVRTGQEVRALSGHTDWVPSVAFSPDGRLVATASYDQTVRLWEVATGREVRALKHGLDITTVRFSPDGHWLASTAYNEDIKLWETRTGREVHALRGRPGALAFSPDSQQLASKSAGMGDAIQLWEVSTGRHVQTLGGSVAPPYGLAMSADGKWLACSGGRGSIQVWETGSGRATKTLTGHTSTILSLHLSADGQRLASLDNRNTVKLWAFGSGHELHTIRETNEGEISALALSPDGQWLATGTQALARGRPASGPDNTVSLWNANTGRVVFTLRGHTDPVHALAFSPDGRWLASGGGGYAVSGRGDNSVRLWDVRARREVHAMVGHKAKVNVVAFSPDGNLLASGSGHLGRGDNTIRLWDTSAGRERRVLVGHRDEINAVAFSPNGRWLASASRDTTVKLWDIPTGREVHSFTSHLGPLTDIAFTPNGRYLVSASQDGSIRLWDTTESVRSRAFGGEELALLATMEQSNEWVVVSPQGLFDGSPQGMQALVAWRIGSRTYPPDRFFADFYTPGLLARLFAGERPKAEVEMAGLKLPPDVRILSPAEDSPPEQRRVNVTVEVKDQGGGLAEVRLYHNGKLVSTVTGQPDTSQYLFREITLIAGKNELRASALSKDRVESNEDRVELHWSARNVSLDGETSEAPPPSKAALYLLVIGINQYEDPDFNLGFAKPDAQAIAEFFGKPSGLFSTVSRVELFDEEATRPNIRKALEELVQKAKPEDLLLIYMAGHGVTLGQQFYFLPHEMRKEAAGLESAVRSYGMPATELGDALFRTRALKQVLIVDACQSEGVLDILRQSVQRSAAEKALEMLARSRGVHLIAASTKEQYAFEVSELGHGVLTYAMLSGLGEKGAPQAPNQGGIVTVTSLLQYINQQVPELTEKYHGGNKQYPVFSSTGMDFPLWVRNQ